jgi:hypothetical protein
MPVALLQAAIKIWIVSIQMMYTHEQKVFTFGGIRASGKIE